MEPGAQRLGFPGKMAALVSGHAPGAQWSSLGYLIFRVFGFGVFSANMGRKFLIALLLVVLNHVIERFARGQSQRIEHPCAFGATPAPKMLFTDPCQFAAHRPLSHLVIWRGYALVKDYVALVFSSATAPTKAAFALGDVLLKSPLFEQTSRLD